MALDSLKIGNIRTYIIEEIRRKLREMGKTNWKIQFSFVKAHIGIQGNELSHILAKETTTNLDVKECYKKAPKCVVISEIGETNVDRWQREWDQTTKGEITK